VHYYEYFVTLDNFINDVEGICTIDNSQDSPEKEDNDEGQSLFALHACYTFHEDEIKREWRHDDSSVEQLIAVRTSPKHSTTVGWWPGVAVTRFIR